MNRTEQEKRLTSQVICKKRTPCFIQRSGSLYAGIGYGCIFGTWILLAACGGAEPPEPTDDTIGDVTTTTAGGGESNGGSGGADGANPEQCSNGIDDDGNGLTDCEDDACAALTCVPAVPDGWDGPLVVYGGDAETPCSGSWDQPHHVGGLSPTGQHACAPCDCASPKFGDCDAKAKLWATQIKQPNCQLGSPSQFDLKDGFSCTPYSAGLSAYWSVQASFAPKGGSCTPSGGEANLEPAQYSGVATSCGTSAIGAGCSQQGLCVPASATGNVCVSRPGVHACPADFPDQQTQYGGDVVDSRTCSACTCESPTGGSCTGGSISVATSNSCNTTKFPLTEDGSCNALPGYTTIPAFAVQPATWSATNCAAKGGEASGTVSGQNPLTVCCRTIAQEDVSP